MLVLACPVHAQKVTFESLLREMVEIERLAELPDPTFVTRQFSSYNRASATPNDPASWFADHDRGFPLYDGELVADTPYYRLGPMQALQAEGTLSLGTRVGLARNRPPIGTHVYVYTTSATGGAIAGRIPQGYVDRAAIRFHPHGCVLADMEGPGALVRIWSANPAEGGVVRIFLDDEAEPIVAGKLQDVLSGEYRVTVKEQQLQPFPPPFAGQRGQGWNLCFPIPYQKRCRVVTEKGDLAYHIVYRQYPSGTRVEPFSLEEHGKQADVIRDVQARLANRTPRFIRNPRDTRERLLDVAPAQLSEAVELEGPAAVQQLRVRLPGLPHADTLRQLVLIAWLDDAPLNQPQVCCPLGDFFGSAPGLNPHASLPLTMQGDGVLLANWTMPFARKARFAVHNHGTRQEKVPLEFSIVEHEWTPRSMHFHARWRFWPTLRTRPVRDLTLARITGQGVFVGESLSVMNPISAWWGEGDPKLYVDSEPFPSHFGTGTDDHFGMGWRNAGLFQHAYHAQTRSDGPGNFGHTSVNRSRFLDRIPFSRDFRFDLELHPWDPNATMSLASVGYWYARPGCGHDFSMPTADELRAQPAPPPLFRLPGALEGEKLTVRATSTPLPLDVQDMLVFPDGRWSAGAQLWARPTRKGVWVDLELPVPADGRYRVVVQLSKGPDYGIIQFSLNQQQVGKPFDGYHAGAVSPSGPVELGEVELKRGLAILRIETIGTNEKSQGPRHAWGLDAVQLSPVPKPRPHGLGD
jgi:hypothetical protein